MKTRNNNYVWCTYRDWSFKTLEGLQDLEGWRTGLIITSQNCVYDFSRFERDNIPILRVDPKEDLKNTGKAYEAISKTNPRAMFFNGWSWMVPEELFSKYPSLVLHPGKLPKDRGGSPIQNQIRNGETWTYANLIEIGKDLDAGRIYAREKISLEGQADDVWARMTSAGIITAKKYLKDLEDGTLNPTNQIGEPSVYKRVKSKDSELTSDLDSEYAERIVRAHNETDPNSYVTPAFVSIPQGRLIIERATLAKPERGIEQVQWDPNISGSSLDKLILGVNNGEKVIVFPDNRGKNLYLNRVYKK